MAIGYDTSSSGSSAGFDTVTIPTFATTGDNRFVFYGVSSAQWGHSISSVVRGGAEAATEKWSLQSADLNYRSYGGYFVAPATATATAVVTLSEVVAEVHAGAIALTGVDQINSTGVHGTASGTSTTATVTVAADAADWLCDNLLVVNWRAPVKDADQTERWNRYTSAITGCGSTQLGSADDVMSWGLVDSVPWLIGAVPVKPVSGVTRKWFFGRIS